MHFIIYRWFLEYIITSKEIYNLGIIIEHSLVCDDVW
jgi:hypothetical protein